MTKYPKKADTPASIGQNGIQYRIPLYQRLFAWDQETVSGLMDDLVKSYEDSIGRGGACPPYYIGLITSTEKDELVDGQQRFTVLMLIGLVLEEHFGQWRSFLEVDEKPRLYFEAREDDNEYLERLLKEPGLVKKVASKQEDDKDKGDQQVKDALVAIYESLSKRPQLCLEGFSRYVYENTSFFISVLPYTDSRALNSYFESLNSTGKNLEDHEILKVNLLMEIKRSDEIKNCYSLIWNAVADMDTPLVRKRREEATTDYIIRFNKAILATRNLVPERVVELFKQDQGKSDINDFHGQALANLAPETGDKIDEISESSVEPKKARYEPDTYRSMLRFSEFILHVLYLVSGTIREEDVNKRDFFDPNNLSKMFADYRGNMNAEEFIAFLLQYRILYDYFVIRIASTGDKYTLATRGDEDDQKTDEDKELKRLVVQFESFQYVYSSKKTYYRWLCPLLKFVSENGTVVSFDSLLQFLKQVDNKNNPPERLDTQDDFRYDHGVDRYWFWRLDYYLWQERKKYFAGTGDENYFHFSDFSVVRKCVDKYTFKRNRSIEHVAAQHPAKADGTPAQPYEHVHDFGNLVLISSGFNSLLRNSSYEVKRAHVETCLKESSSIESLTMLQVYMDSKEWTDDDIDARTKWRLKFLRNTYGL